MVWTVYRKLKRLVGRVVPGRTQLDQWGQWELERQIQELERKKRRYRKEMDQVKEKYDGKIDEAKNADATRVPEIKSEASRLLSKYETFRSQWMETIVGLRFLQQAALGKQFESEGPVLPQDVNPAEFEQSARQMKERAENREDRIADWVFGAQKLEDVHQGGARHMEAMADNRVDAAIQAAREGKEVPTLDELADELEWESRSADPTEVEEI